MITQRMRSKRPLQGGSRRQLLALGVSLLSFSSLADAQVTLDDLPGATTSHPEVTCSEARICCTKWAIDVRRADGTKWGTVEARTYQDVVAKLQATREREMRSCRFFGQSYPCSAWSYDSPDAPRCAGDSGTSTTEECAADIKNRVEQLAERVQTEQQKLALFTNQTDALRARAEAALGGHVKAPLTQVAGAAAGYRDALSKLQRLRETLAQACVGTTTPSATTSSSPSVQRALARVSPQLDKVQRTLDALPPSPTTQTVDLSRSSLVKYSGYGNGAIVLTTPTPIANGIFVPAGSYAAAFAAFEADGIVLNPVVVFNGWQGNQEAVVVKRQLGGASATAVFIPQKRRGETCSNNEECGEASSCFKGFCIGNGQLRFSLSFVSSADLDLFVTTPLGHRIDYSSRSADGGQLDVDQCAPSCASQGEHVENVVFDSQVPRGSYEVTVHNSRASGYAAASWEIEVAGIVNAKQSGTISQTTGARRTFTVTVP